MQMPGVGSSMVLPERYARAVDAGHALFELRWTQLCDNTQRIIGLWDVTVTEAVRQQTMQTYYQHSWFTDNNAYVEFRPDRKGICTGYVPDDNLWHNRLTLASMLSDTIFTVQRLWTRDAVIPARQAQVYLTTIDDMITSYKVVQQLAPRGEKVIYRAQTREEAEQWLDEKYPEDHPQRKVHHVVRGKVEQIEELARRYRGNWLSSTEFQNTIRPLIQAEIDKRVRAIGPMRSGLDLVEQLATLSPEEIDAVRQVLMGKTVQTKSDVPIDQRPIGDIRRIAKDMGLKMPKEATKEELVDAIRGRAGAPVAAPPNGLVGDNDDEEEAS